ncbi:MAG: DDE-type integrase/transposase/recombinase [Thaumarchaeota archaeon]|nr:DDE-type integrase/transposase/recombinase [Nitrososphaerota archaeon]
MDEHTYKVKSQSSNKEYSVVSTEAGWNCSCPDHTFRHICCKHIHAVEFSLTIRKTVEKQTVTIEPINVSSCPQCKSDNIVKHGIRHNKHIDIQRFSCKDCKNRFVVNIGFEKMRATPKSITSAMQLYFTGESLRNVQKFLRLQGVEISHQTVLNWITKYTGLMKGYLDKITPQVGDTWRADEVFVKVSGNLKYLFAMMDDETRFWIAQEVADSKNNHDARGLFIKSNEVAGKKPTKLITDGLPAYRQAFQKEYWTRNSPRIEHESHITLKGDRNNNKMERLNGEFRDREKVMRGVKKIDSVMFDGYQMYHNYLRPHMALDGQTPAEKCGIKIEGNNKWITLIQNASKENQKV